MDGCFGVGGCGLRPGGWRWRWQGRQTSQPNELQWDYGICGRHLMRRGRRRRHARGLAPRLVRRGLLPGALAPGGRAAAGDACGARNGCDAADAGGRREEHEQRTRLHQHYRLQLALHIGAPQPSKSAGLADAETLFGPRDGAVGGVLRADALARAGPRRCRRCRQRRAASALFRALTSPANPTRRASWWVRPRRPFGPS
eukprot:scaffold18202_cov140-Isochrysis_galbana.AAC.1